MSLKMVHITHYDMDGAGCAVFVKNAIKLQQKLGKVIRVYANYDRIPEIIHNTVYSYKDEDICLFITDMRIDIKDLKMVLEQPNVKRLVYIDHHERGEKNRGALEGLKYTHKKFFYRWRQGMSATILTKSFFEDQGMVFDSSLDELARRVDLFDEWRVEDKDFMKGHSLNYLFWSLGADGFVDAFDEKFELSEMHKEIILYEETEQAKYFKSSEQYTHTFDLARGRKLLVAFHPAGKYGNDYTLMYDCDLYLIYSHQTASISKFSVRSRNPYFNAHEICQKVTEELGGSGGGHAMASGFHVPSSVPLETVFEVFMKTLESTYKI
jgi:oligoribonuclease NrnB/cAMP/cGMP phosphodiesterase (DHH superfamily)